MTPPPLVAARAAGARPSRCAGRAWPRRSPRGAARRPARGARLHAAHASTARTCAWASSAARWCMVNFWATWCGPCRQEMPQLDQLYEKYKSSGFVLLGVNVDEDARKAADVAAKLGVTFPVLLDTDKAVSKLYDLSTMPSTVIIDRDGRCATCTAATSPATRTTTTSRSGSC